MIVLPALRWAEYQRTAVLAPLTWYPRLLQVAALETEMAEVWA
ncbi:MAG: hypothetical protein ACK4SA_21760 [Caldilinea sp.]